MEKHNIPLGTLKECLQFLQWLHNDRLGKKMQTQVIKALHERLSGKYKSVNPSQIQQALTNFLSSVSKFHTKLCYKTTPGSYSTVDAQNVTDALLECIPKFLAVMYFLRYQVDPGFAALGGGWKDKPVGVIALYAALGERAAALTGPVDKYLTAESGTDYGGVIPGGFDPGDLKPGYQSGYSPASAMVKDIQSILNKQDKVQNYFLDVYSTTVIPDSGAETPNIANSLRLVQDFYVSWHNFHQGPFSFTGYAREYNFLNDQNIAKKMASWFKKNLGKVKDSVKKIKAFSSMKFTKPKRGSRALSSSQSKALHTYFTQNFIPYGFTFYGNHYTNNNAPYGLLQTEWDSAISELGKTGEGLQRLVDILNGAECIAQEEKKQQRQQRRNGNQNQDGEQQTENEPDEEIDEEEEEEPPDVELKEDGKTAEIPKPAAPKPVAARPEAAKPTETKGGEGAQNQGKKAEGAQDQGKKAEGAQNQGKKAEGAQNQGKKAEGAQNQGRKRIELQVRIMAKVTEVLHFHQLDSLQLQLRLPVWMEGQDRKGIVVVKASQGLMVIEDSKVLLTSQQTVHPHQVATPRPPAPPPPTIASADPGSTSQPGPTDQDSPSDTSPGKQPAVSQVTELAQPSSVPGQGSGPTGDQEVGTQGSQGGGHPTSQVTTQNTSSGATPSVTTAPGGGGSGSLSSGSFGAGSGGKGIGQHGGTSIDRQNVCPPSSKYTPVHNAKGYICWPPPSMKTPPRIIPYDQRPSSLILKDLGEREKRAEMEHSNALQRHNEQMKNFHNLMLSVDGSQIPTPKPGRSVAIDAVTGHALPDASDAFLKSKEEADNRWHNKRQIQFMKVIQEDIQNQHKNSNDDALFMSGNAIKLPQPAHLEGSLLKTDLSPTSKWQHDAYKQNFTKHPEVHGAIIPAPIPTATPRISPLDAMPTGHPIKPPKIPNTPPKFPPPPPPQSLPQPITMRPTGVGMPAYKHPPLVPAAPIAAAQFDDQAMDQFLNISGASLTNSSKIHAYVPVLQGIDTPVPPYVLDGVPIEDPYSPLSPIHPVELEPPPPHPTIDIEIEKPFYPGKIYENEERKSMPPPSVAIPPAVPADTHPGISHDPPRLARIQDIAIFSNPYQCRNPWYVPDSSTISVTPTPSPPPPPASDHLPPPKTVREMLHWLVGLNQYGYVAIIKEHVKGILEDINKDLSQSPDALDITGKPYTLEASHVAGTLTEACLYSANVLHKIKHKDNSKAVSVPDFSSEYSKLYYASDPACLLCQLRDYVYACCHQLAFLKSQCSRDQSHGGWQDCQYGSDVKMPSPLQAFLTDAPDSKFKTQPFDPCNICRKSRVNMGFREEDLPASQQTGKHISTILSPSCGGEDPLLTLSSYLNCLTRRTPRTTGELVSFFHNFGSALHRSPSQLSPLGSALSEPHPHCPDWDALAADDLNAIQYIRGPAPPTSNHDKDHPKTLSAIIGCGIDNVDSPQLMKTITYRAYALYSSSFVHHYLSWAVYLPDRLWYSLLRLHSDLENLQCHDAKSKSLHQCTKALPLLYSHGITPPDGTVQSSLTCSAAVTKLGDVVAGKPIASLMTAMDEFLHRVREPFLYTVFTVWLIATLYIAHSLLYRMDVLHIRSHLFTTRASHLIDVKALLTKGRKMLSLYKDVDYFDDDVHS
ncbi:Chitin bind 4 domain containing protein [Babesia ovata]|uniref:Chitin bind 4 domain containing protein n=1 Tax=Babesia ovata TaxID=189622 RepID=A0A2H6KG44_9APIC|nr:Chitin bind 4 domain containing protein [Babesia ovata]GBE61954.1 Chitin bind 4 domain containing protein [Babesia ovata]